MVTCNIDARGKAVRLRLGILLTTLGVISLLGWALPFRSAAAWLVTLMLLVAGGFSVFEARAGWCALRAMGFKTPV